uniref:Beta-defensin n=1 Tax=Felis catus TaxID=9685 RepID=A0ABI8ALR3_FELCA
MKKAFKRSKIEETSKCHQGYGVCRDRCRKDEMEVHFCRNNRRCCINSDSTILTNVITKEIEWPRLITTSMPFY